MAGTKAGGQRTAATIREKYGSIFWVNLGRKGGKASHTGGFASLVVGADGLTGPERARKFGYKYGPVTKRGKAK